MKKTAILALLLKDEMRQKGVNYLLMTGFSTRRNSYNEYSWETVSRQDEVNGNDFLIEINTYQGFLILQQIVMGQHILNERKYGQEFGKDYTFDYPPAKIVN